MTLLRALLQPRSIAIALGSGDDEVGRAIAANLRAAGPAGGVFTLAQGGDPPTVPDLAIICTPADEAAAALDQAARHGIRTAVVCTEDPDGRGPGTPLKRALLEAARAHGCRFLGPGSAGLVLPAAAVNASWIADRPPAGRLALVAQSSTVAASVVGWASARGIGMSRVIALGDEADLGLDAVLDTLASDTRTQAILLHLHDLPNGRAFMTAARAVARIKPVLVLRPPHIHAGTTAEPIRDRESILDAAFARAGLLRVDDTEEWFAAAESLMRPITRRGGKLAIIANGIGPAMLAAAGAAREGLLARLSDATLERIRAAFPAPSSPGNPLVVPNDAGASTYADALAALQADAGVASAIIVHAPSPAAADARDERGRAIAQSIAATAGRSDLQVSACWFGASPDEATRASLAAAGVVSYGLPEQATRAFLHRERHRRNQEALRQVPATQRQQLAVEHADAPALALKTMDEAESAAFLAAYGMIWQAIQSDRSDLAEGDRDALLSALGFRTVDRADAARPALPLSLAIENDPSFGRVIVVTAAGDRAVTLPPLNRELTRDLALAVRARMGEATRIDIRAESLQEDMIRMANVAVDLPEIVALRLECTDARDEGLAFRASDLRVEPPARAGEHLSIHPYPREMEERLTLKDGRDILLRPIRIEDLGLYREMLERIPRDDLFMRFCNQYSDMTQAIPTDLLANLVHFDYSRDMTFIAIGADASADARPGAGGAPVALGVVDAFVLGGGHEAEFSILVRTDLAGTGLGKTLMTRIIDYCRAKGVETLFGLVLRKNARMLGLAKRCGFVRVTDDEEDEDMVKVALEL